MTLLGAVTVANTGRTTQTLQLPSETVVTQRPITTADLVALRDIGSFGAGQFSVSPDGSAVAFQLQQADASTRSYRTAWFVASTTSGEEPTLVGDGGDVRLHRAPDGRTTGARLTVEPKWSPDGEWIAYPVKKDGEIQIWRSRRDDGLQEQLTHNAADVRNFFWSSDGRKIFFQVGRNREAMSKADRSGADRGFLFDNRFWPYHSTEPQWFDCQQHPWGTPQPASQACEPTLWVYELSTGLERKVQPEEEQEYERLISTDRPDRIGDDRSIQATRWNAAKSRVAWLENEEPLVNAGFLPPLTVYAASAASSGEMRCPADECHGLIETLGWGSDQATVYFIRREGAAFSRRSLYAWKSGEAEVRRVLVTDDFISGCEIFNDRAICLHEGPTTPRKIVSIDLDDGSMETLFDPNPEFHGIQFSKVEKLEWKDAFGNDVFGHLVYPLSYDPGHRYPLVIVQYRSSGFLRGGVGDEYPIHVLAANGFAVLSFDRPNDWSLWSRTRDFLEIETKEWGDFYERRRALTALESILNTLDNRGIVDPERVGITGLSDGAETVQFALIHSDLFAAAAASDSGWNPVVYHLAGSWFRKHIRNMLGPPEGAALENWRQISIGMNAEQVRAPLLVQVADHELLLSTYNYYALRDAGKPIEMHVFPGEYHVKWQPQHRLNIYRRNVQWFSFWLQGMERPDPVDPEQYVRWRKLREQHNANQRALEQAQRPVPLVETQSDATAALSGE